MRAASLKLVLGDWVAAKSFMRERTDEEIAQAVQGGDTDLFGFLVERYAPKMERYARKFLSRDADDVKDIVQEVFIKAYVNIRSFNAARRFSPWLYRIAHNEFVNAFRKKRRNPFLFFEADTLFPHPIAKESADREALNAELRRTLEGSLNTIGAKYREPLVLYYFEEMEYQEIADILHVPVSTVGIRLRRGRRILKGIYERSA